MGSAHNAHPEFGLWSNLHRKDGRVVAFIVCGLIASASGLVLQMAGHDANIDGRSIIAAAPLNPALYSQRSSRRFRPLRARRKSTSYRVAV